MQLSKHCSNYQNHVYLVNGKIGDYLSLIFCFIPKLFSYNQVHSILYSFLPFSLLAIANLLLIIFLFKVRRSLTSLKLNAVRAKKQKSLNLTVISLTLIFILMTSPSAICSIFFEIWMKTFMGRIVISLSDSICFSYHGLNFILLLLSNKKFALHVLKLIKCARDDDCRDVNGMRQQFSNHRHLNSRYTQGE